MRALRSSRQGSVCRACTTTSSATTKRSGVVTCRCTPPCVIAKCGPASTCSLAGRTGTSSTTWCCSPTPNWSASRSRSRASRACTWTTRARWYSKRRSVRCACRCRRVGRKGHRVRRAQSHAATCYSATTGSGSRRPRAGRAGRWWWTRGSCGRRSSAARGASGPTPSPSMRRAKPPSRGMDPVQVPFAQLPHHARRLRHDPQRQRPGRLRHPARAVGVEPGLLDLPRRDGRRLG